MKNYLLIVLAILFISCDDEQVIDSLKFPPEVQITNPNDLETVSDSLQINAVATSNIGIAYCGLWIDGNFVANSEDFSEPYSFKIDTKDYSDGHHSLTVRATDTEGNSSDSEIIDVIFENGKDEETIDDSEFSFYTIDATENKVVKINSNGEIIEELQTGIEFSVHSKIATYEDKLFIAVKMTSPLPMCFYEINKNTGEAIFISYLVDR
jgi:hypothetical protein